MPFSVSLMRKLDGVDPGLKEVLWAMLDEIEQSVTRTDFNELKEIVRELGQTTGELTKAQQRTEQRVEELAEAQKRTEQRLGELAEAQKRTEQRLGELAEAQKRTDQSLERLAKEVGKLTLSSEGTRTQLGGLSRSVAYALENEAYQKLPAYLKMCCQLKIHDHFIRTEIGGKEINFFAKATRNGEDVLVVGETVLKLDDRSKMGNLEEKVNVVKDTYHLPVIPLVVTHYARPNILEKARKEGVIVVQSFEWE